MPHNIKNFARADYWRTGQSSLARHGPHLNLSKRGLASLPIWHHGLPTAKRLASSYLNMYLKFESKIKELLVTESDNFLPNFLKRSSFKDDCICKKLGSSVANKIRSYYLDEFLDFFNFSQLFDL